MVSKTIPSCSSIISQWATYAFKIKRPDAVAKLQVVVTFDTARERDTIRSMASNLRGGDRDTGCQLEPPDHLRGQYQAFQNLAFCLKKKNPGLRRNIKFNDMEKNLTMDIKIGEDWQKVEYKTAKSILKVKGRGPAAVTKGDLKKFLNTSDQLDGGSSDDSDVTMVFNDNENTQTHKSYPHSLSFINTNARSLGPKLQLLADCFNEKHIDIATVTETWFQANVSTQDLVVELSDRFSLGMLTREREDRARNGRHYGGVALVYRKSTSSFKAFPLHNPEGFEVLAAVGKVTGVKGKIFAISCYAPPTC